MKWEITFTLPSLQVLSASVRPKPGFGIGNRNQDQVSVSVSGPELFLPKPKLSFFLLTSDRNRLKPENAEKLLFLRENLPKIQFRYDLKDKEQPQDDTNI